MDANVRGAWLMAQAFGKRALEQGTGGKVLLISSVRGRHGNYSGYTAYLHLEGRHGRVDAFAGNGMGEVRYHGQCNRTDGVPVRCDRVDVRRRRARKRHAKAEPGTHPSWSAR